MTVTARSRTVTGPGSIPWYSRGAALAAVLVAAFVILRSSGMATPVPELWAAFASGVALFSPLAGFLAAIALGPFDDWPVLGTEAGGRAVLIGALATSAALRTLARLPDWWRTRGSATHLAALRTPAGAALAAAAVVFFGTGLGVIHTTVRFGPTAGYEAAELWGTGTGMALAVLFIGAFLGSQAGSRAGLIAGVAAAAAALAFFVGLVHEVLPGFIVSTPLGWLIAVDEGRLRLRGIMSAPNAMAMLALLPACLVAVWMMHRRSLSVWLAGSAVGVVVAVGVLLTFSRSAVLAVAAVAVSYAWYVRRSAAIVMLLVAVVGAAILVPLYLEQRAGTPLEGVGGILQGFFTVGDSVRASGWAAAVRMTLDSPLIGQGFRSYVLLHAQFGDATQLAPHNEWLRLYAEQGIVVGTAGLVFLAAALAAFWRLGRTVAGGSAVALGAFGVLLAYAIIASFNNPLNYAQLNIPVFAVLGATLGLALRGGLSERLSGLAAEASRESSAAGS